MGIYFVFFFPSKPDYGCSFNETVLTYTLMYVLSENKKAITVTMFHRTKSPQSLQPQREMIFLLSMTGTFSVSVTRSFLFLWVLNIGCVISL